MEVEDLAAEDAELGVGEEGLPCFALVFGAPVGNTLGQDVGAVVVVFVHDERVGLALGHVADDLPRLAAVGGPPDILRRDVLEQDDVGSVEVIYILRVVVELFDVESRLVLGLHQL